MLLDTDVLIDLERGHPAADEWLRSLPATPPVAGFAAMELLNGCNNTADRLRVETFLQPFPVLWPTLDDMNRALREFTGYRLSDGLGMIDALIAMTALGAGIPVVTFNIRHFRAVPGLITIQPYER